MAVGGEKERDIGRSQEGGNRSINTISKKRGLEESSFEENEQTIWRRLEREEFKIILVMRKEDEHIALGPIALTKDLKKKLGEIEMAKIL